MEQSIRQLGSAVILQAVKDFFEVPPKKQKVIIKDLKSEWMNFLTDGKSLIVAEQLKSNPGKIKRMVKRHYKKRRN